MKIVPSEVSVFDRLQNTHLMVNNDGGDSEELGSVVALWYGGAS